MLYGNCWTKHVNLVVMLLTCIHEVLGLNLSHDISDPD
jgi:hypothetical protein